MGRQKGMLIRDDYPAKIWYCVEENHDWPSLQMSDDAQKMHGHTSSRLTMVIKPGMPLTRSSATGRWESGLPHCVADAE